MTHVTSNQDLFVALTPYNVFLGCSLALSEDSDREQHLILCADFPGAHLMWQVLSEHPSSPFRSVSLLPGLRDNQPLIRRVATVSRNTRQLKRLARTGRFDQVFVFNERRPESQAALFWSQRSNSAARGAVVEDGMNMYRDRPFESREGRLWSWLRRRLYGPWIRRVDFCGTTPWAHQVFAVFPQLVPTHIGPVRPISRPEPAGRAAGPLTVLSERYALRLGCTGESLQPWDALVLARHSSAVPARGAYSAVLYELVSTLAAQGRQVAVKYHPREHRRDPFELESLRTVYQLPQSLGCEFLFTHPNCNFQVVIGDITSALLTARWLAPQAQTMSVAPWLGCQEADLIDKLARAGVQLVDSQPGLRQALNGPLPQTAVDAA